MTIIANTKMLEDLVANSSRGSRPVPLKETSYDISVVSGLAIVRQKRKFRNDEQRPIEAVLSFPVAFDAVVTSIETEINGRKLKGVASAKQKARKTYEDAIDSGKAAVLHEELLRGLHMVSVANVAPDAEIVITSTFVIPVSLAGAHPSFRVPLTIGEIFGQLPLQDSDQIKLGGKNAAVPVTVTSSTGKVYVNDQLPENGVSKVALNGVIDVRIEGLVIEPVTGRTSDGRSITISFAPQAGFEQDLDIDLMLDTSGSMGQRPDDRDDGSRSKWEVVIDGLRKSSKFLRKTDNLRVWSFGSRCDQVASIDGSGLDALASGWGRINGGGTNLAEAVDKVVTSRSEPQVLLVTDGRAGKPINVQDAVSRGARTTVVLLGSDALEANVGYLASQSGGQMFVVAGSDAGEAIQAALRSMRTSTAPVEKIQGIPSFVTRTVSGTVIDVRWDDLGTDEAFTEHAGAFAAYLAIAGMDEDAAASYAAAEGIVSHLTSIVLVDEAGEAVNELPEQRKVALPGQSAMRGFTASGGLAVAGMSFASSSRSMMKSASRGISLEATSMVYGFGADSAELCGGSDLMADDLTSFPQVSDFNAIIRHPDVTDAGYLRGAKDVVASFDWNAFLTSLTSIPLGTLPVAMSALVLRIAALEIFVATSTKMKVDAKLLAVGIIALQLAPTDRTAQRVSRKLLAGVTQADVEVLRADLAKRL